MAGAIDITRADLEGKFDPGLVRRVFCDNGNGEPGPRLTSAIAVARREADAILLIGWNQRQIEILIAEDDAIRSKVLSLVLAEGMEGRLEWDVEDGPKDRLRKSAIDSLNLVAQAQKRSIAEANGAGQNPHGAMGKVRNNHSPQRRDFVFAPSKNSPSRGGF